MARKAKKKSKKKKSVSKKKSAKKAVKAKKRSAKRGKAKAVREKKTKSKKSKRSKPMSGTASSARRQNEPIPAEPAGRIGVRRPSNESKAPGKTEPREIAQAESDARFDDPRRTESGAREHPDGSMPPMERKAGYRNTDEQF